MHLHTLTVSTDTVTRGTVNVMTVVRGTVNANTVIRVPETARQF